MAQSAKKTTKQTPAKKAKTTELQVLEFLKDNPDFFLSHPNMLENLHLPSDDSGNVVTMAQFQAKKLKNKLNHLEERNRLLVQTSLQNLESASHIQNLILAVIRAESVDELEQVLVSKLKKELTLESVRLLVGTEEAEKIEFTDGQNVLLRTIYEEEEAAIHAEMKDHIHSDALVSLTSSSGKSHGVLVLGSMEKERFHPGQGSDLLTFLGAALGTTLERLTHTG